MLTEEEKKQVTVESVVNLLKEQKLTVTTVESLTGGMLSCRLTEVPGASEVFRAGFVTYSDEAKSKILGIPEELVLKYGAVSRPVAEKMTLGCPLMKHADVIVSLTGIAGPDGGDAEKPVGLVYIGCNVQGSIHSRKFLFQGNRKEIREAAVEEALYFIWESVNEMIVKGKGRQE